MIEIDKILSWAKVAGASDDLARKARALDFSHFEDALQAVSAEACSADVIVTRNLTDFTKSSIVAMSPERFLGQL